MTITALWWAVILSGLYHGLNPGMGWPLAVSAAMFERKAAAMPRAMVALGVGHLAAMLVILLPFTAMTALLSVEREIRLGAGGLVALMGVYLLINRRHPRFLARVSPTRLGLWSFLAAIAHGAALMLVPIYLGICALGLDDGHDAAYELMGGRLGAAVGVSLAHTLAMALSGALLAAAVYRWFGPQAIARTWFNLDVVWALSLVLVGGIGIWTAL